MTAAGVRKEGEMKAIEEGFLTIATYSGFAPVCAQAEGEELRGNDICRVRTNAISPQRELTPGAVTAKSTANPNTEEGRPRSSIVVHRNDQVKALRELIAGDINAFGEADVSNRHFAQIEGIFEALNIRIQARVPGKYLDIEQLRNR
jgi:hypothetical protein